MRIQKSNIILDDDFKPLIVKESAINYKELDNLDDSDKIVKVMNEVFEMDRKAEEYLYIIAMTYQYKPISFFEVSHGVHNSSLVGRREIMIRLLLSGACKFVLVHNHPSGEINPSSNDKDITEKLKKCAEFVGMNFVDSIIIGRDNYFSFRNNGLM